MKLKTYYVTFGVQYGAGKNQIEHPLGFDSNGWVEIDAPNEDQARLVAFRLLGHKWSFLYCEGDFQRSYHPLGCLRRATVDGWVEEEVTP